jgi:hypothetical protein
MSCRRKIDLEDKEDAIRPSRSIVRVTNGKASAVPDYPPELPTVTCGDTDESREAEATLATATKKKPANHDAPGDPMSFNLALALFLLCDDSDTLQETLRTSFPLGSAHRCVIGLSYSLCRKGLSGQTHIMRLSFDHLGVPAVLCYPLAVAKTSGVHAFFGSAQ